MEWKEILQKQIKAKRQILFSKDDPEILSLHLLIGQQPRKAVILWALDLAEETVRELEANCPADRRAGSVSFVEKAFARVGGGVLDAPRADMQSAPAIFHYIV